MTRDQLKERLRKGHLKRKVFVEKLKSLFKKKGKEELIIWSASKVIVRKEWVLPLRTFDFEGMQVTSFNKAEEYLKQHYGENYMVLPNDELRRVGLNRIDYPQQNG